VGSLIKFIKDLDNTSQHAWPSGTLALCAGQTLWLGTLLCVLLGGLAWLGTEGDRALEPSLVWSTWRRLNHGL